MTLELEINLRVDAARDDPPDKISDKINDVGCFLQLSNENGENAADDRKALHKVIKGAINGYREGGTQGKNNRLNKTIMCEFMYSCKR